MENNVWLHFYEGTQKSSLLFVVEKINVAHPVFLMHAQNRFFGYASCHTAVLTGWVVLLMTKLSFIYEICEERLQKINIFLRWISSHIAHTHVHISLSILWSLEPVIHRAELHITLISVDLPVTDPQWWITVQAKLYSSSMWCILSFMLR